MGERDIGNATTTGLKTGVPDYSVSAAVIDESYTEKTYYDNPNWTEYLGYYKKIPELRQAILSLAIWTAGKGFETNPTARRTLERIKGWGEDSIQSILINALVIKKVNGDSFTEIIRNDNGTLINLKPLNPSRIRVVIDKKGLIESYEEYDPYQKKAVRKMQPFEMLHLVNHRTANEIHGTSVIESCKWIIDARNEAMNDWKRILHRSTIRVLEVDVDDTTTLSTIKTQYKDAIKNGEVLILPKQNKATGFQDLTPPPIQNFLEWIRYLENFFYQAVGTPEIILGGSKEIIEASSKISYLTFEQVYSAEQKELESDLWNQLGIRLTFNRPQSLKDDIQSSEAANTGQVGIQNNEVQPSIRKNE